MNNEAVYYLPILGSSLLSGFLGVIVSSWYYRKMERRREKMELLRTLFSARYDVSSIKFSEALNSIFIVFYDNDRVCTSVKKLLDLATDARKDKIIMNSCLADLFKALLDDLNIHNKILNDTDLLRTFGEKIKKNIE